MITPPHSIGVFYTALFEKPIAHAIAKLMSPTAFGDINQVLVTSLDIGSDIEATNEIDVATSSLVQAVEHDRALTFNPIYLPMKADKLAEKLDISKEGEVQAVDGFANPFIIASIKISMPDAPEVIDAKVCYKQFELPSFRDMVEETPLLS
jgi:hypothetical protein